MREVCPICDDTFYDLQAHLVAAYRPKDPNAPMMHLSRDTKSWIPIVNTMLDKKLWEIVKSYTPLEPYWWSDAFPLDTAAAKK